MTADLSPVYEAPSSMSIGFCVQICQGNDPAMASTSLMGIQASLFEGYSWGELTGGKVA